MLLARKSVPAGWTLALFVSKPADTFVHANVCLCRPRWAYRVSHKKSLFNFWRTNPKHVLVQFGLGGPVGPLCTIKDNLRPFGPLKTT